MTEAEWLECADPEPMLAFLRGKASRRRERLFATACCRQVWHLLTHQRSRRALEVAELYADGLATIEELRAAGGAADQAFAVARDYGTEAAKWAADLAFATTVEAWGWLTRPTTSGCCRRASWTRCSGNAPAIAPNVLAGLASLGLAVAGNLAEVAGAASRGRPGRSAVGSPRPRSGRPNTLHRRSAAWRTCQPCRGRGESGGARTTHPGPFRRPGGRRKGADSLVPALLSVGCPGLPAATRRQAAG
jgi:hypothetical protein